MEKEPDLEHFWVHNAGHTVYTVLAESSMN